MCDWSLVLASVACLFILRTGLSLAVCAGGARSAKGPRVLARHGQAGQNRNCRRLLREIPRPTPTAASRPRQSKAADERPFAARSLLRAEPSGARPRPVTSLVQAIPSQAASGDPQRQPSTEPCLETHGCCRSSCLRGTRVPERRRQERAEPAGARLLSCTAVLRPSNAHSKLYGTSVPPPGRISRDDSPFRPRRFSRLRQCPCPRSASSSLTC